jgi:hypothetical protein
MEGARAAPTGYSAVGGEDGSLKSAGVEALILAFRKRSSSTVVHIFVVTVDYLTGCACGLL